LKRRFEIFLNLNKNIDYYTKKISERIFKKLKQLYNLFSKYKMISKLLPLGLALVQGQDTEEVVGDDFETCMRDGQSFCLTNRQWSIGTCCALSDDTRPECTDAQVCGYSGEYTNSVVGLLARPADATGCPTSPQETFVEVGASNWDYYLRHEWDDQPIPNGEIWNCRY